MKKQSKPEVSGVLSRCSNCDYNNGFHIAFKPGENNKTGLIFICPACESQFETGWNIEL